VSTSYISNTATPTQSATTATTATTSSTSEGSAAPGPTQSGIIATCNSYARADGGNICYTFAPDHGITTDQLYAWNPVLGADGSGCAANFLADEWYCVGVGA